MINFERNYINFFFGIAHVFSPNRCNLSKFAKARAPAAGARVEPEQYLASAAVVDIFGG